ncbi:MAG TPA: hypothetical protein VHL58_04320 [Thermoanaerobaculia bacterium]|nr:hypothetical protein [Thermoanaerobaculia bacterium]
MNKLTLTAICFLFLGCAHGTGAVAEEKENQEIMIQVYRADLTPETGPYRVVIRSRGGRKLYDVEMTNQRAQHIRIGFRARKLGSQLEVTVPMGKFSDRGAFTGTIVQFGYSNQYCITLPHTCTLVGD